MFPCGQFAFFVIYNLDDFTVRHRYFISALICGQVIRSHSEKRGRCNFTAIANEALHTNFLLK